MSQEPSLPGFPDPEEAYRRSREVKASFAVSDKSGDTSPSPDVLKSTGDTPPSPDKAEPTETAALDTSATNEKPSFAVSAENLLNDAQHAATKLRSLLDRLSSIKVASRELSLAKTKLQECEFWIDAHVKSVSRNPKVHPQTTENF